MKVTETIATPLIPDFEMPMMKAAESANNQLVSEMSRKEDCSTNEV
jgi:hypothetical protein